MTRAAVVFPTFILVVVGGLSIYAAFTFTWTALQFPLGAGILLCTMCVAELAASKQGRRLTPSVPVLCPGRAYSGFLRLPVFSSGSVLLPGRPVIC